MVYNHTCEGNHLGPTLSMRGVDNASYYIAQRGADRRYYDDFTGCGNTVNLEQPRALQLVMDSLRYWVEEMHVDGFRFDLASALAREAGKVENLGGFFDAIRQDPTLNRVKLIAEPWDLGHGGYQVGNFPPGWAEWNDRYRDGMRGWWKGDGGVVGEVANRLAGSQDLYGWSGKRPHASINFVTAHDGFTLHDLVSYNDKHNEANGEDNRDGNNNNLSWNCGVEGPTDDPEVNALRERQKRNFLATLLLSQGVPMLLAGDERGHTQRGNNNVYCQDNELTWLDWTPDARSRCRCATSWRPADPHCGGCHPSFRRRSFFRGQPAQRRRGQGRGVAAARRRGDDAARLGGRARALPRHAVLGHRHHRRRAARRVAAGRRLPAAAQCLPRDRCPSRCPRATATRWTRLIDTAREDGAVAAAAPSATYPLQGRSLALLRRSAAPRHEAHASRCPSAPSCCDDGGVRFRLWAPAARSVVLELAAAARAWRAIADAARRRWLARGT